MGKETKKIEQLKANSLIHIEMSKGKWKKRFTLRARFDMRVINFFLPGILKIRLNK